MKKTALSANILKWRLTALLIVGLGAGLSGCQTVQQITSPILGQMGMATPSCIVTDWYNAGLLDGRNGEKASLFDDHARACAGNQQRTEVLRYMEGRDAGLKEYCKVSNAATLGLRGNAYQDVCPANVAQEFRSRNFVGLNVYAEKQTLNRLESERIQFEEQLRKSRSDAESKKINENIYRNTRELERSRKALLDAENAMNKVSAN